MANQQRNKLGKFRILHDPCPTIVLSWLLICFRPTCAFRSPLVPRPSLSILSSRRCGFLGSHRDPNNHHIHEFNPFDFNAETNVDKRIRIPSHQAAWASSIVASLGLMPVSVANAVSNSLSKGDFDPATFKPVCSASDGFYRFLQSTTQLIVGDDAFVEYGPLIAGGLLRIRLELCVVESFFNEAVTPFIKKNGLNWVLPLHETVETFLAGSVFALASTFILVGSTKIVAVVFTYIDFLVGVPCRLIGGFTFDRALGKPVTLEIGIGPFKTQVIGPKKDEVTEPILDNSDASKIDISKIKVQQYPVLLLSGVVKATGEISGVSLDNISLFYFLIV